MLTVPKSSTDTSHMLICSTNYVNMMRAHSGVQVSDYSGVIETGKMPVKISTSYMPNYIYVDLYYDIYHVARAKKTINNADKMASLYMDYCRRNGYSTIRFHGNAFDTYLRFDVANDIINESGVRDVFTITAANSSDKKRMYETYKQLAKPWSPTVFSLVENARSRGFWDEIVYLA